MELTVMTFNLRYNTPNDGENAWPLRVHRVSGIIQDRDPVIVGTQEGYRDMLIELHGQLPGYEWIGSGRFGGQDNEHCAIFYKNDRVVILEHGQFWLSESPEEVASKSWDSYFPRICTWARCRLIAENREFMLYNTHLDHASQEARDRGIEVIWSYIITHRSLYGLPAVLMGDMNSFPEHQPIRFLEEEAKIEGGIDGMPWLTNAYTVLPASAGLTAHNFHGGDEGKPIDYIFVSPEISVMECLVDRRQIDGGYPSDHYPIVARLKLA
ncbi:endonuclease/exonuclease/phosphatase family protein [Paenibacillus sedimenti]|uniref:Endonuclease/exonuclease/phosphatase family protein n=1 Tax=Paenibacillus sedimenti TaxID=2770274 RepID=A0A926QHR3_9BACL|nr:endonuclease/exonuclease/phosphatase family protein [Paenibacillus sedimenti]MBD0378793.1 endonuclease/exonuclease/phosphatase family protein [Paenibacillus sedimenti]